MENFEFKGVEKRVTEFRVTCMGTVKKVFEKRTTLDVDVQSEIKRLKTGDMVIIDQIFEIQLGGGGVPELNEKSFPYTIIN